MCGTTINRGLDDEGIYIFPRIGLGEERLLIIDLGPTAGGPLANEDKTIWIVLNGEIYNFQELRSEFVNKRESTGKQGEGELWISGTGATGYRPLFS